ncbi:MAG: hypothetical protein KDD39_12075, partial [Bdellovibrionales bacterium]|nr:hypothetical protein [Bdellovibrionales bacterium]
VGILSFFSVVERFHLNPEFFPQVTKDLFSEDEILKNGILPLGFKRQQSLSGKKQFLNVGFLSPRDGKQISEVEAILRSKHQAIAGLVRYQIDLNEYLLILDQIYGISPSSLSSKDLSELSPVLQNHLQPK